MKNIAFFGVRRGCFPRRCPQTQRQHDDKHIRGARRHFRAPLSGCFALAYLCFSDLPLEHIPGTSMYYCH